MAMRMRAGVIGLVAFSACTRSTGPEPIPAIEGVWELETAAPSMSAATLTLAQSVNRTGLVDKPGGDLTGTAAATAALGEIVASVVASQVQAGRVPPNLAQTVQTVVTNSMVWQVSGSVFPGGRFEIELDGPASQITMNGVFRAGTANGTSAFTLDDGFVRARLSSLGLSQVNAQSVAFALSSAPGIRALSGRITLASQ